MELLERTWETIGNVLGGALQGFERSVTALFGSSNARQIKKMQTRVDAIGDLESKYEAMSEEELRQQTELFRERLKNGETLEDLLVEAFAVCREGGKRFLGMRHYDVQLIGGMVLHSGSIAEMVTGEGKTLVATLPAYLNALTSKGVHVVTVNDYLARRDMEWMAPLYMGLGITVGAIQSDMPVLERQKAYACDITYGTNNEFGFDYLRDNMRPAARGDERFDKPYQQSQGPLNFAIVDEVDNILIDEARTPLIISGPAEDNVRKYAEANRIAIQLQKDVHFKVNEKDHTCGLTDEGIRHAEKLAGVESFYTAGNMQWPHLIDNSLKAHHLYKRDVNYVIKEGRVIIVDEFTGRLMDGRQWSDGLHQAVEAKEGVKIKEESQTLATITLQNFFKLYSKICGMTGTAMTEANEFWKIYKLDVVAIPTNRGLQRKEYPDVIFRSESAKYRAVADEIERINRFDVVTLKNRNEIWGNLVSETDDAVKIRAIEGGTQEISRSDIMGIERKGRPVLVGTVSIEKSERLSRLLDQRGVKHAVLNAKHHKREAQIVAQAGRQGAVTIATNMAGRGTDIILGGNAETLAWAKLQDTYATRLDVPRKEWDTLVDEIEKEEDMVAEGDRVRKLGGLHVIGTERHDARRIDLQLRGRCGRQGDPGSSRFFLSLEDDLLRIFAGEWVKRIMETVGRMTDEDRIESGMITRRLEAAQKKREEHNFEIRKNLLEYDEVMDEQRKRVYAYRQQILDGKSCRDLIIDMVREQVDEHVDKFLAPNYSQECFATFAGSRLAATFDARDFRRMDFPSAVQLAKDQAERQAESNIQGAIDENLPSEEDPAEWSWGALATFANSNWELNLRDRDLKKIGAEQVSEFLFEKATEYLSQVDLEEGRQYLEEDFPLKTIAEWASAKFDVEVSLDDLRDLAPDALKDKIHSLALAAYDRKEYEYPAMASLAKYSTRTANGIRLDREGLAHWASSRFKTELTPDDLKHKQLEEIREVLLQLTKESQQKASEALQAAQQKLDQLSEQHPHGASNGALSSISQWLESSYQITLPSDSLEDLEPEQLERRVTNAIEDRFRPEIRRMERSLLLQIVDSSWKNHLQVMDHLRSSVSLAGFAQLDPKVEYKREGMRMFDQMWSSIGERSTDLVFRVEMLNEDFVQSTWVETEARHDQLDDTAMAQMDAVEGSQGEKRVDPIRNRGQRVKRNDPCPCNSGKKYKNCCMRKAPV